MKKLLQIVIVLISITSCISNNKGYVIKGEIKGKDEIIKNGTIYLRTQSKDYIIIDSTNIINGKFQFVGKVETPDKYIIYLRGISKGIPIFIENERFWISSQLSNLADAKIKGGKTQQIIDCIKKMDIKTRAKYEIGKTLSELRDIKISEQRKTYLIKIIESANNDMRHYIDSVRKDNPVSNFTLINTIEVANTLSLDELVSIYNSFSCKNEFVNNRNVFNLKKIISIREKLELGQIAPNFTLKSNKGKFLSLSDLSKQNVLNLIVFWASWDTNSFNYSRGLSEIYQKYHLKGLEIIDISVNDVEKNWKDSIAKKNLLWIHLIDDMTDSISATRKYNIQLIPHTILVDKNQKIIAKNLTIEDLREIIETTL